MEQMDGLLPSIHQSYYTRRMVEEDLRRQQAESQGNAYIPRYFGYDNDDDLFDINRLRRAHNFDADSERGRSRQRTTTVYYGPEPQPSYISLVTRHVFTNLFDIFNLDAISGVGESRVRLPLAAKKKEVEFDPFLPDSSLLWLLAFTPSIILFAFGITNFRSCNRAEPLLPLWLIVLSFILAIYTTTSAVCFYCTDRVVIVMLFAFRILAVMLYIIWAFAGLFFVLIMAGAFGVPRESDAGLGSPWILNGSTAQIATESLWLENSTEFSAFYNYLPDTTTLRPSRRRFMASNWHVYRSLRQCDASAVYFMATVTALATVPLLFYAFQQCYWCITFMCWFGT